MAAGKINGLIGGKHKKYNITSVKQMIESNGEYVLISNTYTTVKDNLRVKHLACGNEFDVCLDHFKNGTRCPYCCHNPVLNTEIVKKRVDELTNGEFIVSGEYINAKTQIGMFHTKCQKYINVVLDSFWKKPYCPFCGSSKGEQKIEKYLIEHNLSYKKEYTFADFLSSKDRHYRFDFAIFINDKILLVEYDGEFHFEKFYDEQNFEQQQENDDIKNLYAFDNNIPLLRIPYTQFDEIEEKLEVFLIKYA